MRTLFLVSILTVIVFVMARKGFGPNEQEWGYITVRPGAHLFWWLHKTTAVEKYVERPLVIWIQGGPGIPASGYGNLAEFGPIDINENPRNSTWVQHFNILLVDSPVGTGFSYVDSNDTYATTNTEIAQDFVMFLEKFYEAQPEFKNLPVYIFGQSYGGKMGAEIALLFYQKIENGTIQADFQGVGFGGAWISPIDFVLTWGPYLLHLGYVDQKEYKQIQEIAEKVEEAVDIGDFRTATNLWGLTQFAIMNFTHSVDFYNVLMKVKSYNTLPKTRTEGFYEMGVRETIEFKIASLMNTKVKKALGMNRTWMAEPDEVFNALEGEFMKPVTDIVEQLLNTTDLRIAIYNGQLDLIVDTLGAIKWVERLNFNNSSEWVSAPRTPMVVDNIVEGYRKKVDNLAFYWVNRAGHWVPSDNPKAMRYILDDIINGFK